MAFAALGTERARTSAISWAVALTIHSVAAILILRVNPNWNRTREAPVEIEVREPPPPAEIPPAQEPPPEPVEPKIAPRRLAARDVHRPETPSKTPPPPNQEPPPNAPQNAPPVFGVTMSSVVSGEATMALPVGNTTMTKSRSRPSSAAPVPYAGRRTGPFEAVPEIGATTRPRVLHEVNSEDVYPPDAKTLGIEGIVKLSVLIDPSGQVVDVRILPPRAGHGFDEAAAAALKGFLFSPARTGDGRAVPFRLPYQFTFSMNN